MSRARDQAGWELLPGDLDILRMLAGGETVDLIARQVGMSERTVRRRLRAMAERFGVETTIEVVVCAVRHRLI